MRIVEPSVELLSYSPDILGLIERAGRTCYKSEDKMSSDTADAFARKMIESGHHSVLEHGSVTIKFICDRGVIHELVRHRLCPYSQESTRYCNYHKVKFDKEISFIRPPGMDGLADVAWCQACLFAEEKYMEMIEAGMSPQIAQSVLPICLKTEIVTTANVREWRHILTLRISKKAHPQIRKLMIQVWQIMFELWPPLFEDIFTYSGEDQ